MVVAAVAAAAAVAHCAHRDIYYWKRTCIIRWNNLWMHVRRLIEGRASNGLAFQPRGQTRIQHQLQLVPMNNLFTNPPSEFRLLLLLLPDHDTRARLAKWMITSQCKSNKMDALASLAATASTYARWQRHSTPCSYLLQLLDAAASLGVPKLLQSPLYRMKRNCSFIDTYLNHNKIRKINRRGC